MSGQFIQPDLFDLPDGVAIPRPRRAVEQAPLPGVTTWRPVKTRRRCTQCQIDQATAHQRGYLVQIAMTARYEMTCGSDHTLLCTAHAITAGYKGRA